MVSAQDTDRLLHAATRLRIQQDDGNTLIARSGPHYLTAGCIAFLAAPFVVLALLAVVGAFRVHVAFLGVSAILALLVSLPVVVTLKFAFPRQWHFNRKTGACTLRNIPRVGVQLHASDVSCVELLATKNANWAWVVLTLANGRRPYFVCGIKRMTLPPEVILDTLMIVAKEVAVVIGCPVRQRVVSSRAVYSLSWW